MPVRRKPHSKAFTLIELLVVIAIIGILAAIAIPQFTAYRKRGYNARAESDVRNAATAEEAAFVDRNAYASCTDAACSTALPSFSLSEGVSIACIAAGATFTCTATHASGDKAYTWTSAPPAGQPNLTVS